MSTVIIVGAGQAGCQTAVSLREEGFDGRIVLLGDEPHPPYQRPPLSKGHLTGKALRESLWLRPECFYSQHDIELRLPERVTRIDRDRKQVRLGSGPALDYDNLVLALGARNRRLPLGGVELDGVAALRTLAEADDVRDRLTSATDVVVIGGGFIGLEVAATAIALGKRATVIEIAPQLMGRVMSAPTADFLVGAHRARGLDVELRTSVAEIVGEGNRVTAVRTADGRLIRADLVLIGVGAQPNVELAAEAGLAVDDGIVVDQQLRTTDPSVSAAGDCAAFPSPFAGGRHVRLESVQNAAAQPRCVAARIVGRPTDYHSVPWFWSDQADLKLQIAGLTAGHRRTAVLGETEDERFSVLCFDGADRLMGVESVNRPADHMATRRIIKAGAGPSRTQALEAGFSLTSYAAALKKSSATA
jgi:3-phenylpropionate/trans-cinnamate dioxygenase ferredoxin reductase component